MCTAIVAVDTFRGAGCRQRAAGRGRGVHGLGSDRCSGVDASLVRGGERCRPPARPLVPGAGADALGLVEVARAALDRGALKGQLPGYLALGRDLDDR